MSRWLSSHWLSYSTRGGTLASAVLHLGIAALLLIPVGKAIESGLFDRHLVYLIPPDRSSAVELEAHGGAVAPGAPQGGASVDQPTDGPRAEHANAGDAAQVVPLQALELTRTQPLVTESALTEIEVDRLGVVDTTSYTVVQASRSEFSEAVRQALSGMHFRPAMQRGRLVRQWVEQTFHFRIERKPE